MRTLAPSALALSFRSVPVVHHSLVALRFWGDDLDPDQITLWLGVEPSVSHRKGDEIQSRASGARGVRKTGLWLLRATAQEPGDLDAQIKEILDGLPSDIEVWKRLEVYKPDLSIGLFLAETNEGIGIGAATIRALALRGVALDFDLYGPIADA